MFKNMLGGMNSPLQIDTAKEKKELNLKSVETTPSESQRKKISSLNKNCMYQ